MLYAKIMLDYAHYAHPENLPSMVRYSCRRYGQGWWPATRRQYYYSTVQLAVGAGTKWRLPRPDSSVYNTTTNVRHTNLSIRSIVRLYMYWRQNADLGGEEV